MKVLPKRILIIVAAAVCVLVLLGVIQNARRTSAPGRPRSAPAVSQATSSVPATGVGRTRSQAEKGGKERGSAQPRVVELRGFRYTEYYEAPQETKLKTRLQGAKARPEPGGLVAVSGARLETFLQNGQPELVMEAPNCMHDANARTISSPGPLLVKMADGSFSIHGEGFVYQQTNSVLIISNRVETVAQPELLQEREASPAHQQAPGEPMKIASDQFQYSKDDGVGVYRNNVQVTGTNLSVACGLLTLKLPVEERRLRSITAGQDVTMDYAGMKAQGQSVIYNVDTAVAEITGKPTWSSEGREGRADKFIIDRTNRLALAQGNAWLRMPGQSLAANLLPSFDRTGKTNSSGPQSVEVRSADYELRTNSAIFKREVVVTEMTGAEAAGRLKCSLLTVTFMRTNQLERLVAEDGVEIERGESRLRARDAVYTATNNMLALEGNPSWQAGAREGKGDHITVDTAKNKMRVSGDASMRMPAEALSGAMAPAAPNHDPAASKGQFAEIRSAEYSVQPEEAVFSGGVRIAHPQTTMSCDELSVHMPPQADHVEKIVADGKVTFDLVNEAGERMQGASKTATYSYKASGSQTNEQLMLTGDAMLKTPTATFSNQMVIYDSTRKKWMARGMHSTFGVIPEGKTNLIKFPK